MTPEALAYCEKQTKRIATLEQQNAELVAALEKAAAHVRPTCSDLYDELETALSKVKQP